MGVRLRVLLAVLAAVLVWGWATDRAGPAYPQGAFIEIVVQAALLVFMVALLATGWQAARGSKRECGKGLNVESLDEWRFEFSVTAAVPIGRTVIDSLLDEAICWSEARRLGIGGGYRPATTEEANAATAWRFEFGLCVQAEDLLIPEPEAAELLDVLRGWCGKRGLSFAGGFQAFMPDG